MLQAESIRSARCSQSNFFISARARKKIAVLGMLANARKDHSSPLLFLRLFSSHVLLAVITLFLQTLAFYHVNDVKIHTSEEQLKDLG